MLTEISIDNTVNVKMLTRNANKKKWIHPNNNDGQKTEL